jgi:hypothetical protein
VTGILADLQGHECSFGRGVGSALVSCARFRFPRRPRGGNEFWRHKSLFSLDLGRFVSAPPLTPLLGEVYWRASKTQRRKLGARPRDNDLRRSIAR